LNTDIPAVIKVCFTKIALSAGFTILSSLSHDELL